jgi:cell division protein FtsI/penicillin-binding protein 2
MIVFACALLAAPTCARADGLPGPLRACMSDRLAKDPGQAGRLGELDAFALMDVHTGRILWHRNPAMLARYDFQPGSIFKVISAYAALSTGQIDPNQVYRCRGWEGREGPVGHQLRCWLKPGHGPVNFSKALAYSCNLFFARLGTRIGPAVILKSARDFGLGLSTRSDLPGEVHGTLPAQASRQDVGRLAIGLGRDVYVTGIQVLSLVGAIANGGVLYSPRTADPGGPKTPQRGVIVDNRALGFLRSGMQEASTFGTGAAQKLGRLGMAGKTGTAAWRKVEWRSHGWYMGFWPMRSPQLAVVAFVHQGLGSNEAAAVARTVLLRTLEVKAACEAGQGRRP